MRILYVEDSPTLRSAVSIGLKDAGYSVTTASDGTEGLNAAQIYDFDVILLDIMLPGLNGYAILRELRKEKNEADIILLSARAELDDRITGLDMGADDYLVKPFAFEELLARIRALKRRRFGMKTNTVELGALKIDISAKQIFFSGKEISLRPREFDILEYLAMNRGKTVTRTELTDNLYDHAKDLKSNAIDSAICNIRKALADVGCENIISTIPRRGYLFDW